MAWAVPCALAWIEKENNTWKQTKSQKCVYIYIYIHTKHLTCYEDLRCTDDELRHPACKGQFGRGHGRCACGLAEQHSPENKPFALITPLHWKLQAAGSLDVLNKELLGVQILELSVGLSIPAIQVAQA